MLVAAINYGLQFTPQFLPVAGEDTPYTGTITAINGQVPYRFTMVDGVLPAGITFVDNGDSTASFTGTASAGGTFYARIRVRDAYRRVRERVYMLQVAALPLTLTGTLADATIGVPYSDTLTVGGGVSPYTIGPGSLPPGLAASILGNTITVDGTPTTAETDFPVSITVIDDIGNTATFTQNMNVIAVPVYYVEDFVVSPAAIFGVWSVAKRLSDNGTVALRQRRSSDSAEQDISFVGDLVDTAAAETFAGAGSGYMRKWYDQWTTNHTWEQSTAGQQPAVVVSGAFVPNQYDGTDDNMSFGGVDTINDPVVFVFMKARLRDGGASAVLPIIDNGYTNPGINGWIFYREPRGGFGGPAISLGASNSSNVNVRNIEQSTYDLRGALHLITVKLDNTAGPTAKQTVWIDKTLATTAASSSSYNTTGSFNSTNFRLGVFSGLFGQFDIESLVIVAGDVSATRSDIEDLL